MMQRVLNLFLGSTIQQRTNRYLRDIADSSIQDSRKRITSSLRDFRDAPGTPMELGKTTWGENIAVPMEQMVAAHSLITGGTGSGKTRFALLLIKAIIDSAADNSTGFGVLDPKGELFMGSLLLLAERIRELQETDPPASERLRQRVVIVDFSSRDPVSPYNILANRGSAEADFFAASRADLLLDLLPGSDGLSLGASALLRRAILLLSEFDLPITQLDSVLHDAAFRVQLLHRSKNETVKSYFDRQFASAPKQTIAAISRRMDALFSSESVRLSLSGDAAPDFRELQDSGAIVLVNAFGANISRSVRQLLQALVLCDVAQSVFSRQKKEHCFPWFCDEAQNFFGSQSLRDRMHDVLTMSRSFGTHLCCLTQNIGSAVSDPRLLHSLYTNIRWSLSLRGEPGDCAFLKAALPVTGRTLQPQNNPFKEPEVYSLSEERTMELNGVAHLPDRVGYFWHRPSSGEAVKMRTADLILPDGVGDLLRRLVSDPVFGKRVSRQEHDHSIARSLWQEEKPEESELNETLLDVYRRRRGVPS